jgi:HEAT repeat-containing protein 5
MAASCLRTLVLLAAHAHATPADQSLARALLPRLVTFVARTDADDPERARALVAHTLCQYAGGVSRDHAPVAMALVVPTLLARAAAAADEDDEDEVYRETSARLLELASADQAAFRGVVGGMSEAQRGFMEGVIRSGRSGGGQQQKGEGEEERPTIALKMNFGG